MTGLPEYRNGGLLLDLGLLEAKYPGVTEEPHRPEEEVSGLNHFGVLPFLLRQ